MSIIIYNCYIHFALQIHHLLNDTMSKFLVLQLVLCYCLVLDLSQLEGALHLLAHEWVSGTLIHMVALNISIVEQKLAHYLLQDFHALHHLKWTSLITLLCLAANITTPIQVLHGQSPNHTHQGTHTHLMIETG